MSSREIALTPAVLRDWPLPAAQGSKHDRGRVLVLGGARATPGAAILAGSASLRVGAGHLSLAVAESVATHVAVALPECGVTGLAETESGSIAGHGFEAVAADIDKSDAVLVGPGLDEPDETKHLVTALFEKVGPGSSVALDAFALGVLPDVTVPSTLDAARFVLTPNVEEQQRLLGQPEASGQPEETLHVAQMYDAVVSCAGVVAEPDGQLWRVESGHPGLATSGSGDVMAGAVAGFLARGASASQAACCGTFVHAAAGDRLAATVGEVGFLARELLDHLPQLLTEVST